MGQKVHPYGFRLGFNKTWRSRWFSGRDYQKLLHEDLALRADLKKRFAHAGVARIETERAANKLKIDIYTSRPGSSSAARAPRSRSSSRRSRSAPSREIFVNIQEIQKPELEAQLIGESVAAQLEKRVAFRRAMRKAVESALRFGARASRCACSGRLERRRDRAVGVVSARAAAAADAARGHRLWLRRGQSTYGQIGVKVWLYKGERLVPRVGREEEYRDRAPRAAGARLGGGSSSRAEQR